MAAKKGMDICYHQGDINFKQVKQAGYDFIIPRDGWGEDDLDPKLIKYTQEALKVGMEVPGVYHFIYASNTKEALENAECAIANVKAAGLPKTTVIWCDFEYDTVDNARDYRGVQLTTAMQRQITEVFCDKILAEGYPTGIYTNKDFVTRVYGKSILNKYDIWLADLEGDPDYPCVYQQVDWYARPAGCPTNVDVDVYHGQYTVGTAKPKEQEKKQEEQKETVIMSSLDSFISAVPEIKSGSSGEIVKVLQIALKELGYYKGDIDGAAGPQTIKAIKDMQKAFKINADGIFGKNSWTKLLK